MGTNAEQHRPGEPPEVQDEAADTPMWVPALGLAMLLMGAVFLIWQSATEADAATDETEELLEGEAGADEAGAEGAEPDSDDEE